LDKGKLCAVVGPVSVSSYEAKDGSTRFSLEVRADDVEFLSPKEQSDAAEPPAKKPVPDGFTEVDDLD
jgi:single-stranded DNA-binding protein